MKHYTIVCFFSLDTICVTQTWSNKLPSSKLINLWKFIRYFYISFIRIKKKNSFSPKNITDFFTSWAELRSLEISFFCFLTFFEDTSHGVQGGKTKSLPLQNTWQFPKYCNFFSDSLGDAAIGPLSKIPEKTFWGSQRLMRHHEKTSRLEQKFWVGKDVKKWAVLWIRLLRQNESSYH